MTFYNKIKWALGILMIFMLVVSTNLIDRGNFIRVRDSMVSIYEDRLIAKNLIFEMSNSIHKKELAAALGDSAFFTQENLMINQNMENLISLFEGTKLISEERKVLNSLKANTESLKNAESEFLSSGFTSSENVFRQIQKLKVNLEELATIQISEGRRQMLIGQRAVETVELYTQIEIYMLVFLAIIVQIIVMYKPKEDS